MKTSSETSVYESGRSGNDFVEELRTGSPEAFEELVHIHARRLYSVARRILGNVQDAEDCLQEAFFKAHKALPRFRGQASLATWLHRIVANQALMKLRKRRASREVAVEDYLPQFVEGRHAMEVRDWGQRPDEAFQTGELAEALEMFIRELPAHYREPYILKDVEKLPEAEVGRMLGLPVTTIKNRVHRARLMVRGRLDEYFLGPVSSSPRTDSSSETRDLIPGGARPAIWLDSPAMAESAPAWSGGLA